MKQQAQEMSSGCSGMYRYKHRCEGGVDIHDVFVKNSAFRVLLSYIGTIFLLANVCHSLLSKIQGVKIIPMLVIAVVLAILLRYKPVKKESLVIMPAFGVQHFS